MTTLEIIQAELRRQAEESTTPSAYFDDTIPNDANIDGHFDLVALAAAIDKAAGAPAAVAAGKVAAAPRYASGGILAAGKPALVGESMVGEAILPVNWVPTQDQRRRWARNHLHNEIRRHNQRYRD